MQLQLRGDILVRDDITVVPDGNAQVTKVAFKNCVLFTKCFTKIDGAAGLDLVMLIHSFVLRMKQPIWIAVL